MEFRVKEAITKLAEWGVDIGTEWNLEYQTAANDKAREKVDIGTEWNLE